MKTKNVCSKKYIHCIDNKEQSKTRKKMNKKSHKKRHYGGAEGNQSGAVSETVIMELLNGGAMNSGEYQYHTLSSTKKTTPNKYNPLAKVVNFKRIEDSEESFSIPGWDENIADGTLSKWDAGDESTIENDENDETVETDGYEEQESGTNTINKIDQARTLFQQLINRPDAKRGEIIQAFVDNVGVTQSTAVSYYERFAKEAGLTGKNEKDGMAGMEKGFGSDTNNLAINELPGDTKLDINDQLEDEDSEPNRRGIIRTVPNAHLVFKRQSEDGTFEELWLYNIKGMNDELKVRRSILAGTDILPRKTRSEDGKQHYNTTTLGNAQLLNIQGLSN